MNSTIRKTCLQDTCESLIDSWCSLGAKFGNHCPKSPVDISSAHCAYLEHCSAFAYFTARLILSWNFSSAPGMAANPSSPLVTSPESGKWCKSMSYVLMAYYKLWVIS
jgi:hypothetical protein